MDQFADAEFPLRGVSLEREFAIQSAKTTPVGQNVRVFEPSSFRGRGGSRPGLSRFINQLVSGANLIQHLNTVVRASASAVPVPALDPIPPNLVIDPSSPGPPDVWGTGTLYVDGSGNPVTGQTLGSRVPAPPGHHRKVRDKGTGYPSYKNTLTEAPPPAPSARGCFQGIIAIRITKPDPDPLHWTGQEPAFSGVGCMLYQPPLQPAPPSATIVPAAPTNSNPTPAPNETLQQYIARWLTVHVGSDSYGLVISDATTDPATVTSGGCTAGQACSAGPPTYVPTTNAVGTIIHAA